MIAISACSTIDSPLQRLDHSTMNLGEQCIAASNCKTLCHITGTEQVWKAKGPNVPRQKMGDLIHRSLDYVFARNLARRIFPRNRLIPGALFTRNSDSSIPAPHVCCSDTSRSRTNRILVYVIRCSRELFRLLSSRFYNRT
jgi:hypothetical protein